MRAEQQIAKLLILREPRIRPMSICPICGFSPRESFSARYVTAEVCGNPQCGHIYAESHAVGQGIMRHDFAEEYRLYQRRNHKLISFWLKQGFINQQSSVLDVGAGGGHIVRSVRELLPTVKISCVEPDPQSADALRGQGFEVFTDMMDVRGSFDCILAIEVLEHVDHPVELLTRIRQLLTFRGRVFLTTPCGETRRGSRATNAYDTKEHIHFFTERSLQLSCEKAGFCELRLLRISARYPYQSVLMAIKHEFMERLRDSVYGRRHLTGFIKSGPC